ILVTVPSRRMSNEATTRGANCTLGSTVDCSQALLTLRCTASTYHEKRAPKFPAPAPSKPMPAWVLAPAPIAKELYGTVGVPPPSVAARFCTGLWIRPPRGWGFLLPDAASEPRANCRRRPP